LASILALPVSANADSLPEKLIIEGGPCEALDVQAPLSVSLLKVTCVEKDGVRIWSTNPKIYRQLSNSIVALPCDAECEEDRKGIASGEIEAADAKTFFPKWVVDAQNYFSKLVLKRVKEAFGDGKYSFIEAMPLPSREALSASSLSSFGGYKLQLRTWSENEIIGLTKDRLKGSESQVSETLSNSSNLTLKLDVDKNSDGKYLVAVFTNAAEKSLALTASKSGSKRISIIVRTDKSGYGSILTSQKLSGYKVSVGTKSKVAAQTVVK
jgi:hypothetical protein